jgi:hypothetical protein
MRGQEDRRTGGGRMGGRVLIALIQSISCP